MGFLCPFGPVKKNFKKSYAESQLREDKLAQRHTRCNYNAHKESLCLRIPIYMMPSLGGNVCMRTLQFMFVV